MAIVALYLPVEGVILPTYFNEQGQPARLGIVLMALSLGGIAGSLAYGKWGTRLRRRTAFVLAMVGVGVPLFGMALLPPFTVMVLFATIAGFLYGPIAPLENYAMQTRTPEELRGRAFGVLTSAAYAAGPVGYLAGRPTGGGPRPASRLHPVQRRPRPGRPWRPSPPAASTCSTSRPGTPPRPTRTGPRPTRACPSASSPSPVAGDGRLTPGVG